MKKIFYIILVIVALMVISRFVKQGSQETVAPTTTVVEAVDAAAVGNAEIAAPDEEIIEETVVDGVDDNGMEEETVLDVEETAPAAPVAQDQDQVETPAAE